MLGISPSIFPLILSFTLETSSSFKFNYSSFLNVLVIGFLSSLDTFTFNFKPFTSLFLIKLGVSEKIKYTEIANAAKIINKTTITFKILFSIISPREIYTLIKKISNKKIPYKEDFLTFN